MLHKITFLLLTIGGINWLVFGLLGRDLGSVLGGMDGVLAKTIYIVIGLAAIYELAMHKKQCKECEAGGAQKPMQDEQQPVQ